MPTHLTKKIYFPFCMDDFENKIYHFHISFYFLFFFASVRCKFWRNSSSLCCCRRRRRFSVAFHCFLVVTFSHSRCKCDLRPKKYFTCPRYLLLRLRKRNPRVADTTTKFLRKIMFFKWTYSGLFLSILVLFKHKFYRTNCRRQWDSNWDCQRTRRSR